MVYCDNISAIYMSSNPVQHQRTNHVEIDLHFIRENVALGIVRVLHVPTTSQFVDIFTKGLPSALFIEFRTSLNVRSTDANTARGGGGGRGRKGISAGRLADMPSDLYGSIVTDIDRED
jgi:hypothetical protein